MLARPRHGIMSFFLLYFFTDVARLSRRRRRDFVDQQNLGIS